MSPDPTEPPPHVSFQVFLDGIIAAVRSVFFYVLVGNYVGLGALAHEVGFSFWWMALSTMLIWAAPAQVILVSTLTTASLWEVALAVTLSSVRFLPMVAAILPVMRRPGVRQRDLLLPMHLTAISVWVEGMRLLPLMPVERRIAFYNGLGVGLMSGAVIGGAVGFVLAARLPPLLVGGAVVLHADGDPDVVGPQQPHPARRAGVRARARGRPDRGGAEDRPRPDVDRTDRRHHGLCGPSPARGEARARDMSAARLHDSGRCWR